VLDALAKADAKQRPLLLATLGRIGGADALPAVMKDLDSSDAATKDAAARALADWQGAEAIQPLWQLAADTKSDVYRVLAIRGIVRIVGRDTKLPPGDAASALCHAFFYSKTLAEKNLVVGALGNIRTIESLEVLWRYLDDKDAGEGELGDLDLEDMLEQESPEERHHADHGKGRQPGQAEDAPPLLGGGVLGESDERRQPADGIDDGEDAQGGLAEGTQQFDVHVTRSRLQKRSAPLGALRTTLPARPASSNRPCFDVCLRHPRRYPAVL
jgi:hypothetical protein